MSIKDKVKIFTGSGIFKLPENKTDTKTQIEEDHDNCGTPDCCGDCETAEDKPSVKEDAKVTAYAHIKRKLN